MKPERFSYSLREEEAAPPMGGGAPPANPDNTTNKHHFASLQRELGIEDDDFDAAIESDVQTLYNVPDYGWGFRVQPPVQATVQKQEDGSYNVTFMLSVKKLMNPKSFVYSYKDDENPLEYEGEIEDKTENMEGEELQNLMVKPYEGMGMGGPPGMGGPMGGMPPMGGAMPDGGMGGAPPMGMGM